MNNSSSTETDDCYPSAYHDKMVFVGLHLAVILIGIPSNVFFLFVSYRLICQKNELGVYLFNLALSDFLFIMCLPVWVKYGIYDEWDHGKTMCVVCVFLLFTNFYTSAVLLSCIAVDRYIAIVHPLQFCTFRKRKTAASVSVAAWILLLYSMQWQCIQTVSMMRRTQSAWNYILCPKGKKVSTWLVLL